MDEHELRDAFRATMTMSRPPAPMSTQRALSAGRRALLRQRLSWAGAASAAATIIAVVSFAASSQYLSMQTPGGPGPVVPVPSPTARPWPSGSDSGPSDDSTARSGRQYDTAVELLTRLRDVVPADYTTLEVDPSPPAPPARSDQATFADGPGG